MKPARQREMVDHVRMAWQVSIRRACRALPVERSNYHYRSRRAGQPPLSKRIKEIAETRVRYGYRRIHVLLRREGWMVNHKRVRRLYREQGLQLRNKTPKRRVKAKLRSDRLTAKVANDIWAMDFLHDAVGRREDPCAHHGGRAQSRITGGVNAVVKMHRLGGVRVHHG
jgi:putative transposase